jgi:hypothetical protein
VGVNHHLSSHFPARVANLSNNNNQSWPLLLAKAMGGKTSRIPCAVVGSLMPFGPHPAVDDAGTSMSLQMISDVSPTLELVGLKPALNAPSRSTASAALNAAAAMSLSRLNASKVSMVSAQESYTTGANALAIAPPATIDFGQIAFDYTGSSTRTIVNDFAMQLAAAETMFKLGSKVVVAMHNGGWDTHNDPDGVNARNKMTNLIMPPLNKFLARMMPSTSGFNITTAIMGDFARSLPFSDHASVLSASVIGKRVKVGTTGRVDNKVGLPTTPSGVQEFWSYLSDCAGVPATANPFGTNTHRTTLLLP